MTNTVTATPRPAENLRLAGIDTTLYFITDTLMCSQAGRSVAETAEAAVAGGAGLIQVRDKDMDDTTFTQMTLDVVAAVERARTRYGIAAPVPVFVDDRVEVAARLINEGVDVHVHVGQTDTPVGQVRDRIGNEPLVGLSAATPETQQAAYQWGEVGAGGVDLFGSGPVWDTTTKEGAPAGRGVPAIAEFAATARIPVFAIGGINAQRAVELRGSGVAGICVVSAICLASDPRAAARELYAAFAGQRAGGSAGEPAGHRAGGTK